MEKRASIVRGCLFIYGLGLCLLSFASLWNPAGRLWTAWADIALALVALAFGSGFAYHSRPHRMISTLITMGAALVVLAALQFTVYALPFYGTCHLLAAGCFAELTVAIARGLPTGGSFAVQRNAAEALERHAEAA